MDRSNLPGNFDALSQSGTIKADKRKGRISIAKRPTSAVFLPERSSSKSPGEGFYSLFLHFFNMLQ